MRFGKKGKLSPGFIGPYEITERIGPVAYGLALPDQLSGIHDVFHVSMLRRYRSDPMHVLLEIPPEIDLDLTYVEEPLAILDREGRIQHNKSIPLVKVHWNRHLVKEATWEHEEDMRAQFPQLFIPSK